MDDILIVMKKEAIISFFLLLGILTGCKKSEPENVAQNPFYKQYTVGNRNNSLDSGSWWGENITKIVHKGGKTFTAIIDDALSPRTVVLYGKEG